MGQRYNKNAKTGDCGFQKVDIGDVRSETLEKEAGCQPHFFL